MIGKVELKKELNHLFRNMMRRLFDLFPDPFPDLLTSTQTLQWVGWVFGGPQNAGCGGP